MMKRFLVLLLAVCLAFALVSPTAALAVEEGEADLPAPAGETIDQSGNCGAEGDGSNMAFRIYGRWTRMIFDGTGVMADYTYRGQGGTNPPAWRPNGASSIYSVTFDDAITGIGSAALAYFKKLENVTLPNKLTKIGNFAFMESGLTSITFPASVNTLGRC